jgi:hypothetical protein
MSFYFWGCIYACFVCKQLPATIRRGASANTLKWTSIGPVLHQLEVLPSITSGDPFISVNHLRGAKGDGLTRERFCFWCINCTKSQGNDLSKGDHHGNSPTRSVNGGCARVTRSALGDGDVPVSKATQVENRSVNRPFAAALKMAQYRPGLGIESRQHYSGSFVCCFSCHDVAS